MNLFQVLNGNNYFSVNRSIAHQIGLNATVFLSEIIDKFCYFENLKQLNDGWFYLTIETVEERTTLGREAQDAAIKKLKDLGLIETKQMGMPAKRHFRIFQKNFAEWVNPTNKFEENHKQECGNHPNKNEEKPQPTPIYKNPKEEVVCNSSPPVCDSELQILQKVKKKDFDSKEFEVSIEDVFKESILQRKSWTSEEIREAWIILCEFNGCIRDPIHFIDGTIKKMKNIKKAEYLKKEKNKCIQKESNSQNGSLKEEENSLERKSEKPMDQDTWMQALRELELAQKSRLGY